MVEALKSLREETNSEPTSEAAGWLFSPFAMMSSDDYRGIMVGSGRAALATTSGARCGSGGWPLSHLSLDHPYFPGKSDGTGQATMKQLLCVSIR
ncbi:hypothetical protein PIB30_060890 [Stylosanthes scabra]|uniref:Uncharacterized protein n=1 Tax=Stylosanthes scabra TaxID=79078 RepID=A0ABU6UK76_9FABA|nr:hypothetical protein [Stylosanthes scabra]